MWGHALQGIGRPGVWSFENKVQNLEHQLGTARAFDGHKPDFTCLGAAAGTQIACYQDDGCLHWSWCEGR